MSRRMWRDRLARWPAALLWVLVAFLIYLALNGAAISLGHVPDYDGLVYVNAAMKVNLGLSGLGLDYFHQTTGNVQWAGLPFTNTLDVLVVALLWNLIDYHLALWLIHSAYLVLFVVLMRRILRAPTVLMVLAWASCSLFFLHQYLSFISELEIGLYVMLFVAYLFHDEVERHLPELFLITLLLLLMRTINLALIGPLVAVFTVLRWLDRPRRRQIWPVWKAVGLAILLLLPLLAHEARWLILYVGKTTSDTAQNWRDMTGVYSKGDLLAAYRRGLETYDGRLMRATVAAAIAAIALQLSPWRSRMTRPREYAIGALVVFGVLMQALTTNTMVVFWVFALIGLFVAALLDAYLRPWQVAVAGAVVAAMSVQQNHEAYRRLNVELAQRAPLTRVLAQLSDAVAQVERPVICSNYGGVGPIDIYALELAAHRKLGYMALDTIAYTIGTEAYVRALEECNIALVANRNFMWSNYLGVNHQTEAVARYMAVNAAAMGFAPMRHIEFDDDPARTIDVFDRPSAKVSLKYLRRADSWLEASTPVRLAWPGAARPLDRYVLEVDVMIPQVAAPKYALPLQATLVTSDGRTVGAARIERRGDQTLAFPLDGLAADTYRLEFDRTFRAPGDRRELSAQFRDVRLRFAGAAKTR
jgi:hypothetical protein